jgi:hypothetical protein
MKADSKRTALAASLALAASSFAATSAYADEGGVSFWLPGQLSSFAAVPSAPGFSLPIVYYHTSIDAGGQKNFVLGGNLVAGIDAKADLAFMLPTYTFATPVAGGQAAVTLGWAAGSMRVSADAQITGPLGNTISVRRSDEASGGSDLYPLGTLKWHDGVNNWMTYAMADFPTGSYQLGRLANIGINHWAVDAGGGYTYLDPAKGHEFSVVGGLTYNFENNDTDYRNGVDSHIEWAASQFLNEQFHIGLVGYLYYQLSGDSGSGAILGSNKARVYGVGPQGGYFFPVGSQKGYVNLRGYWEFGAENRPEGWNLYLTLSLPLGIK